MSEKFLCYPWRKMKAHTMPASSSWSPRLTGSIARWTCPRLDVLPGVCCYIPILSPLTSPLSPPPPLSVSWSPCPMGPSLDKAPQLSSGFLLPASHVPVSFPGGLQCGTEGEIPKVLRMGRLKEDFKRVCSGWPVSQRRLYTECKGELSLQTDTSAHFIISFPLFYPTRQ